MPQPPNDALGDTLEARDPQNDHLGRPNKPLEYTLGPQDPQNGALEVPLKSFLAPKVLKLEPFGTPLGTKIAILGHIGSTLNLISLILLIFIHFGVIVGHFLTQNEG